MKAPSSPNFRTLFEAAPGLYLVLTPRLQIVAVSDAYLLATMTTRQGILGRNIFEVFPDNPDDPGATGVNNLRTSLERVLETRRPDVMAVQKYDVRRPAPEGGGFEERHWSPVNSPVLSAKGEVVYIIHRVEDVTDFIRLKQAEREQEKHTRALQDRAERVEAEVYLRAQELAGVNRQLARVYRQIASLLAPGAGEPGDTSGLTPEAMVAQVERLMADHHRLEEQLRQSQKMEAVGRLAGGVAHDFNNLLTVISGYAAILRQGQGAGATMTEIEEIEKAAIRAASLTQKLLAFSRKQVLQPRVIDLNAVLKGMEELLRRLIGEHIDLVTTVSGGLGRIKADPNQVEQVIMNLAVNARDAMPEGGRLLIETSALSLNVEFPSLRPGAYVVMSVSDTGHGMDAQTAARVFEPFFTTKEVGKGTGLGLATVYGIVEQSGGIVTLETAAGAGAKFRVYLPVNSAETEEEAPEPGEPVVKGRRRTILLVEDEAPLRKLVSEILTQGGYSVLAASSGEDAIAQARKSPGIDLLLTDVVMPGLSGPDLVLQLHVLFPELPVLYMSGYDRELIGRRSLEQNAGFLPKPFTPRALLTRVGDLLGVSREVGGAVG